MSRVEWGKERSVNGGEDESSKHKNMKEGAEMKNDVDQLTCVLYPHTAKVDLALVAGRDAGRVDRCL